MTMRIELSGDYDKGQASREMRDVLELVVKPLEFDGLIARIRINGDYGGDLRTASIAISKDTTQAYLGYMVFEGGGNVNFTYLKSFNKEAQKDKRDSHMAILSLAEPNSIERLQGMVKRGIKACLKEIEYNVATRHTRYLRKFSDKMRRKWKDE